MKKKIVYFLCDLGLFKIAEKISSSIVGCWRGEKITQGIKKAFEEMCSVLPSTIICIEAVSKQIGELETKDK